MHDDSTTPDTIPYGYCHCGCGQKAPIAKKTQRSKGHVAGEPVRFISQHHMNPAIKYKYGDYCNSGICHCGCGQSTPRAKQSNVRLGHVKGEPVRYISGHNGNKHPLPDGLKTCGKCKRVSSVSEYGKDRQTTDGLRNWCKDCSKAYRLINADAIRERQRRYYYANRDYQLSANKAWRMENASMRAATAQNRRARIEEHGGNVSASEWRTVLARFNGKCAKCGSAENIHMDHVVPLAKGGKHSIDNVQPLCATCNLRKGVKTEDYRGKFYQPLSLPLDNDT